MGVAQIAQARKHDSVVRSIYDAALDDSAWSGLAGVLVDEMEGESGVVWQAESPERILFSSCNHGEETAQAYAEHFRWLDPWNKVVAEHGLYGRAFHGGDLVPDESLKQGEFYHDFLRKAHILPTIGTIFKLDGGAVGSIGLHRPAGASAFSDAARDRLQDLLWHVRQVMVLRRQLRAEQQFGGMTVAALDRLSAGMVICDGTGTILFANAAAEALAAAKAGIILCNGERKIGATDHTGCARLHALIAAVGQGGAGGALCLRDAADTRLMVVVSPVPGALDGGPGRVMVSLRSEAGAMGPLPEMLIALFGMTVAEADLSWSLLQNQSLGAIRQRRGVSENTVRTQLAHVLSKTGTANQRELVRLLSLVPVA